MLNDWWEEQDLDARIKLFHDVQSSNMALPKWVCAIKCPFCNKELPHRGVRNIQLCLNSRNFGEIAIEVFCDDCSKMDTLYLRTKIKNLDQFMEILSDPSLPSEDPVIEEEMYKKNYNNIIEEMFNIQQKGKE